MLFLMKMVKFSTSIIGVLTEKGRNIEVEDIAKALCSIISFLTVRKPAQSFLLLIIMWPDSTHLHYN